MKNTLSESWVKKYAMVAVVVGASVVGSVLPARAAFTFTLSEVGSNVVGTGTGSFDLSSLTYVTTTTGNTGYLDPSAFIPSGGATASTDWYQGYAVAGNPGNFGTGGGLSADSSVSGGFFVLFPAFFGGNPVLEVATGYTSNTPFTVSSTWTNKSFASLGITPGTYTWQWSKNNGSGPSDSVTVNAVPEPSALALLAIGAAGLAIVRLRKKASAGAA
ncbi:MAG: PEP-CTERM sorting domain-containing protein [Terrimicrobiaceae bacterium]